MNDSLMGIDLGTSSVKVLVRYADGAVTKVRREYPSQSIEGWSRAIFSALEEIDCSSVVGIGLSSQVGTYIVNDSEIIPWDSGAGGEELAEIKQKYSKDIFMKEISMPHPDIISYPIPRLRYIGKHTKELRSVCQPKDIICELLTGKRVTDPYSFRGLCNMEIGDYSDFFLSELGIDKACLPPVCKINDKAGELLEEIAEKFGFPKNTAVYIGLNDFYAALLSMGITKSGDAFDITGTSEHFGIIENSISERTPLVSSRFFSKCVHYGVTASSGCSVNFGSNVFGREGLSLERVLNSPPIFAPYLKGERAPVFDADASGVFFGITESTTKSDMAYSVVEGVVFSLYHIYDSMGRPPINRIIVAGGGGRNKLANEIKAELFGVPIAICNEIDTSALGAVMVAAVGHGKYAFDDNLISDFCAVEKELASSGKYKDILKRRYEIYKTLYPALAKQFKEFREIKK